MRIAKDTRGKNYWDLFNFLPGQMNAVFTKAGVKRGLHRHKKQHEYFFIVSGSFRFHLDGQERTVNEGELLEVRPNKWHGLGALEDGWFVYYQKNKFDPDDEEIKEWIWA
jgi:quercetin dioxygenase-like cupin family protein